MADSLVPVFIALGSNIEPETNLPEAVDRLAGHYELVAASSVWESAPVGFLEQPPFLNAAVLLHSCASLRKIKDQLLNIEQELGRQRDPFNKNGPRTIDLDIALYGTQVVETASCVVPDPDIPERTFLAVPLAELDFDRIHPVLGVSLGNLARNIGGIRDLKLRADVLLQGAQPTARSEFQRRFN